MQYILLYKRSGGSAESDHTESGNECYPCNRIKLQFGLSIDDGQMVRLVVEDNGCGIPKDLRKHVFEPFFTTKKDGKGTGIGLTVVKRMVEEHGGWIQVQSEEEKGTTFIMNFPRVDDSE